MVVEVQAFAASQNSQRPSLRDPRAVQKDDETAEVFNRVPVIVKLEREQPEEPPPSEARESPAQRIEGLISSSNLSILIDEAAARFVYRSLAR